MESSKKEAFSAKYNSESIDKLTSGIALQKINKELDFIKLNRIAYEYINQNHVLNENSPSRFIKVGDTAYLQVKVIEKYTLYSLDKPEQSKTIDVNNYFVYVLPTFRR